MIIIMNDTNEVKAFSAVFISMQQSTVPCNVMSSLLHVSSLYHPFLKSSLSSLPKLLFIIPSTSFSSHLSCLLLSSRFLSSSLLHFLLIIIPHLFFPFLTPTLTSSLSLPLHLLLLFHHTSHLFLILPSIYSFSSLFIIRH